MPEPEAGFPPTQRVAVAALYWEAFGAKLDRILGPRDRAMRFLVPVLDPGHAISVTDPEGRVVGIAGFKTADGAFVGGGMPDLAREYGWFGAAWRAPLLALLERKVEPGLLLMDGIAVAAEARGRGIGSQLLDAIVAEAHDRGCRAVRLDVIDINPRARSLYERKGFRAVSTETLGPFRFLFGFRSATRMEKAV